MTSRMRKFGMIAAMGFLVVSLLDFLLYQFGASIGFNELVRSV